MGWFIGRLGSDLRPIMTSEVTPEQKKEFELLLERMESDARSGRIKFIQLGPWLEITRDAMGDRKITPQEVDEINLATDKLLSSIRKRSAAPGVK